MRNIYGAIALYTEYGHDNMIDYQLGDITSSEDLSHCQIRCGSGSSGETSSSSSSSSDEAKKINNLTDEENDDQTSKNSQAAEEALIKSQSVPLAQFNSQAGFTQRSRFSSSRARDPLLVPTRGEVDL